MTHRLNAQQFHELTGLLSKAAAHVQELHQIKLQIHKLLSVAEDESEAEYAIYDAVWNEHDAFELIHSLNRPHSSGRYE